jgi:hypothetical protein
LVVKIRGVGRDVGHDQFVSLALSERPTDDQLRSLHEYLRGWPGLNDNTAARVKTAIDELTDDSDQNREARYRQALYIIANSAHQSGDLIVKYAQERLCEIDPQ